MIQFCCHVFPTVLKKLLKLVYFPSWLRLNAQTSSGPAGTHCFSGRDSVVRNAKPPPQRTVKMMLPTKVLILAPDHPMEHSWSPVFSNHQNSPPQQKNMHSRVCTQPRFPTAFVGNNRTKTLTPFVQTTQIWNLMLGREIETFDVTPPHPNWMDLPKPLPQQVPKWMILKVIEARMCKIN